MKVKCINKNDFKEDFWGITYGKEYEVIVIITNNEKRFIKDRYEILNDNKDVFSYPISCFEVISK